MQYIEILIRLHKLRHMPLRNEPGTLTLVKNKWQYRNNPSFWEKSFTSSAQLIFPIINKKEADYSEWADKYVARHMAKHCYQTRTLITIIKYLGGYDETTCSSSN